MTALRPVVTAALASAAAVLSACATPSEAPPQARVRIVFHPYAETLRMRIAGSGAGRQDGGGGREGGRHDGSEGGHRRTSAEARMSRASSGSPSGKV